MKVPYYLLEAIKKGDVLKFYKSKHWAKCRKEVLDRDNNECQHCKREGKVGRADAVHHMVHLRDDPSLALDPDNLITLCKYHHNLEHPEKTDTWKKSKISQLIPERY